MRTWTIATAAAVAATLATTATAAAAQERTEAPVARVGAVDAVATDEAANARWTDLTGALQYDAASARRRAGRVQAWVRRRDQPGMVSDDRLDVSCPSGAARLARTRTATGDGRYVWTRDVPANEKGPTPPGAGPALCRRVAR